ncbi:NACHT, LRR and PYD domains-containing protein 4-like [Thomomys bottae]
MASSFFSDFGLMWYLEELSKKELVRFKECLKQEAEGRGLRQIPWSEVKKASKESLANLLTKYYEGSQAWAITRQVFKKIGRNDLCEKAMRESTGHERKYRAHMKEKVSEMWRRESITETTELLHQKISREDREHFELFLRPKAPEKQRRTLFFRGFPKVGKTTLLMKLLLTWADGSVGQDKFTYVFYFCCRELKKLPALSLAELIAREWHEPAVPHTEITAQPERLLFLIDSFEQLQCDLDRAESELCSDWLERRPVPVLLASLLRKKLLPDSSLLVATTLEHWQELEEKLETLEDIQVRTISGFDDNSKKIYFSALFPNWSQAVQAFNAMKGNEQLSYLCEIPMLCWVVGTCLKLEMERGREPARACRCTTSLYTSFVLDLFTPRGTHRPSWQSQGQLRGLCSLAAEGMWTDTFVFPEDLLGRNGIAASDIPALLDAKVLLRDKQRTGCYTFLHLSVQEFCAALFYVLKLPHEHPHPAVAEVDALLVTYLERSRKNWIFLGCFLVGLLHEQEQQRLDTFFGSQCCQEVKRQCDQCLRDFHRNQEFQRRVDFSRLSYCLFEMQNETSTKEVMETLQEVDCTILDYPDLTISSHCLKFCRGLRRFCLCIQNIWPKQQHRPESSSSLVHWYQICSILTNNEHLQDLQIKDSILNESACVALYSHLKQPNCRLQSLELNGVDLNCETQLFFDIFVQNPNLKQLCISSTELSHKDAQLLCHALSNTTCNLESLVLEDCSLSSRHCEAFASMLASSRKLKQLSLTCNYLEDGMHELCKALCSASSILSTLMLAGCYLTEQYCPALCEVLVTSRTLSYLDLSLNTLKDRGLEILCEALQVPHCSLRSLCVVECGFTTAGCCYLVPVLTHSKNLRNLQIGANDLGDAGAKVLCEALASPTCGLQNLGLNGCELTSACCQDLYSTLTCSKSLEGLNLSSNPLDFNGVAMLCEALNRPECPLKMLLMSKVDLEEDSQALLRGALERNPNLVIQASGDDPEVHPRQWVPGLYCRSAQPPIPTISTSSEQLRTGAGHAGKPQRLEQSVTIPGARSLGFSTEREPLEEPR